MRQASCCYVDILLVCLFVGASVDIELTPLHLLDTLTEQLSHVHLKDFGRQSHLKIFMYAYETIA